MTSWRTPHLDEDAADDAERHQPARRPRVDGRDRGAQVGGRPLRRAAVTWRLQRQLLMAALAGRIFVRAQEACEVTRQTADGWVVKQ